MVDSESLNRMHCCDGCRYFDAETICEHRPLLDADTDSCYEPEDRTMSFTKEMLNTDGSGFIKTSDNFTI